MLCEARDRGDEIDEASHELLNAEPAPVLPEFQAKECEDKFDTETPEVIIPCEVINE